MRPVWISGEAINNSPVVIKRSEKRFSYTVKKTRPWKCRGRKCARAHQKGIVLWSRKRSKVMMFYPTNRTFRVPCRANLPSQSFSSVWRSRPQLGGNRRMRLSLPGTEGAAHTSQERTEPLLDHWLHRVTAQRNGHYFMAWYTDPDDTRVSSEIRT